MSDDVTDPEQIEQAEQTEAERHGERFRALTQTADRFLVGGGRTTPADALTAVVDELAQIAEPDVWDRYGEHGPVEQVEKQVAALLDKPAAAMFPSGVMAQQVALRIWTERRGSPRVAIPQLSHLLLYELDGPAILNGLRYEWLTQGAKVPVATELAAIPGKVGAALMELPLRDGGYLLPSWDELAAFSAACGDRDIPLHIDGARLWESQPYLGHSLAEISALADSVYVSFYKGLRGLSGAALAGSEDFVAEARQWRRRFGGTVFTMLPQALSALRGLRLELPRMGEYVARAGEIADQLRPTGVTVFPDPPHTNAFRLYAPGEADDVNERLISYMEHEQVVVCSPMHAADAPGQVWTEFAVGPASMEWSAAEIAERIARALLP